MSERKVGIGIVDDNVEFARTLADFVSVVPHLEVVGVVSSVNDGLDLLTSSAVELALVDVHMPDGGGVRIAETIKDWPRPPKLALISAGAPTASVLVCGAPFVRKQDLRLEWLVEFARGAHRE